MKLEGIKKLVKGAKERKRLQDDFERQTRPQANDQIRFYNLWNERFKDVWFYRFIESRHLLDDTKKRIAFYSVFGSKKLLDYDDNDLRCFFTAENVHAYNSKDYADLFLTDNRVDLSMAFDFFDDEKYLRLPTWVLRFFAPEADFEGVRLRCKELSNPQDVANRRGYTSIIASWDPTGIRKEIFEGLSQFGRVDCAGKWMHNDDSLKRDFGDDKLAYLKTYRYNVCPENSNAYGYVTEKLFDAIEAGCVPVYWGSYNKPELDILNQEAILFWDFQGENAETFRMIEKMERDSAFFDSFANQERLLPGAAEKVYAIYDQLENKLRSLINS